MAEYTVVWEIQVDAESPEEAARKAKRLQARPDTTADVYEVHAPDGKAEEIDLSALDGRSID